MTDDAAPTLGPVRYSPGERLAECAWCGARFRVRPELPRPVAAALVAVFVGEHADCQRAWLQSEARRAVAEWN